MWIRQETRGDFEEVDTLVKAAFAAAEHSDGTEQDLVAALSKGDAFVPELSLVAEVDGKLIGHILFTKAEIGDQSGLVLAPLAVLPGYQKRGVGAALIQEGHRIAKELGYSYSSVLGSEQYYPRFGYVPAEQFGIETPDGFPPVNFLAIQLQGAFKPVHGTVKYAREFGIGEAEARPRKDQPRFALRCLYGKRRGERTW